ncbi:MAG TPA: hypothetical protein VN224_08315, partial [Xanthomonadales bacterium]|nr:hypothetical protein [Xanthomonadales bacterium]
MRSALDDIVARAGPVGAWADPVSARPRWAGVLEDALRFVGSHAHAQDVEDAALIDSSDPLPFEGVFVPYVLWARSVVGARAASTVLMPGAVLALERSLLRRLTELCAPSLLADLDSWRQSGRAR